MEWTGLAPAIVSVLLQLYVAVATVVFAPVDLLVNALVPQATTAIQEFFTWIQTMLYNMQDFLDWFIYVIGITPVTWNVMSFSILALMLAFLILFPIKIAFLIFKGMK